MAIAKIKHIFKKYPILANSVVYGTLYTGAEFSQQTYTKKIAPATGVPAPYDLTAMGRYGILGLGLYPQVYYFWYRWLDGKYVGTATLTIVKKMALDQFVLTPPLIASFYLFMSIMEQKQDVFEECRNKLLPTFMTSCVFWLPAQGINFLFIPPAARVVYVGSCAFIWVNVICWFKRQDYSKTKED
ncbi:hypothetical protein R5R35_010709 [Gryllus longicercus]|uniref:Mpv17-like protein n=1 Tax=Gryllus longicercus TaxID=2509291 RepID=A0AAN9YZ12_9ORTH